MKQTFVTFDVSRYDVLNQLIKLKEMSHSFLFPVVEKL